MSAHGQASRAHVEVGGRRVPGLYSRRTHDGREVFETRMRLDGRIQRHTLLATTKTDAVREMEALRVDTSRGEAHRSAALVPTCADVARDWLGMLEARTRETDPRRRCSPNTLSAHRLRLDVHVLPVIGSLPVTDVTVARLRRMVADLSTRLAPSSVSVVLATTSGLMRHAVRDGLLDRNPVRDLDRDDRPGARRRTEPRYLRADELDTLLRALGDVWRPVAACCAYAGLRVSEALGLTWEDVDFTGGTLHVRRQLGPGGQLIDVKTVASAEPVPMLPALARELKAHRSRVASVDLQRTRAAELVFQTRTSRPQSRRNALRALHAAGDSCGLNPEGREKVGMHDLRHSFVSNALDSGATLAEAAALARHADARVTAQVYAGLADDGRARAAEKLMKAGFGA